MMEEDYRQILPQEYRDDPQALDRAKMLLDEYNIISQEMKNSGLPNSDILSTYNDYMNYLSPEVLSRYVQQPQTSDALLNEMIKVKPNTDLYYEMQEPMPNNQEIEDELLLEMYNRR